MLWQLHHQFDDGRTDMKAQKEFTDPADFHRQMCAWEAEVAASYPLPEGSRWLLCNEKSPDFVMAAADDPPEAVSRF